MTTLQFQLTTEALAAAALMATVAAATMCFSKRFEIRIFNSPNRDDYEQGK
jgi:hypothetical protein